MKSEKAELTRADLEKMMSRFRLTSADISKHPFRRLLVAKLARDLDIRKLGQRISELLEAGK